MSKAQAIAQQLNLTPQQKEKILPILAAEVQKCTPSRRQFAFNYAENATTQGHHQQTDPEMKAILSPEQYQKLRQIRAQTIREATQGTMGH